MAELSDAAIRALEGVAQDRSLRSVLEGIGGEVGDAIARSNTRITDGQDTDKFFSDVGNAGITLLDGAVKFGGSLATGTAKISQLSGGVVNALRELPGIGPALGKLGEYGQEMIKFAEGSIDTLEGLSGSGASFNNSIIQMNYAASQSRLTLDEFAGMVRNNSEQLVALGGSVTEGAKTFSRMSNQFFNEGLGDDLLNMGMTFEEVNENLMTYMEVNRRNMMYNNMSDKEARDNAAAMAKEMDLIAKLTGKDRKEMEANIQARMRSGQVQAKLRLLEMQGNKDAADNFRLALAEAEKAGPDAVAALEETFTKGTVVSEAGRRGLVALGSAGDELTQVVHEINRGGSGVGPALDNFNAAIVERVNSREFLQAATLGGMGGVVDGMATVLENAGPYADAVAASQQGAIDESSSREAILSAVQDMEEMARNEQEARDGITHTMQMADARMKDVYASFGQELYAPGTGVVSGISNSDALAGPNGAGRTLDDLTRRQIQTFISDVRSAIPGLGGGESFAANLDMRLASDTTITQQQRDEIMAVVDRIRTRIDEGSLTNANSETAQTLERLLTGPNTAQVLQLLEDLEPNLSASQTAIALIQEDSLAAVQAIADEITAQTVTPRANAEGIDGTTQGEIGGVVDAVANAQDVADANRTAQFNAENMTVSNATVPPSQEVVGILEQIQQRNNEQQTSFETNMGEVNTALSTTLPESLNANAAATTTGFEGLNQTLSTSMDAITGKLNDLLEATNIQTRTVDHNNRRVP